jgi:hypothetical protein
VRVENFRQQLVHGLPFQSSSAIAGIFSTIPRGKLVFDKERLCE